MKSYEQLIRSVVEGQVNAFINDHPEVMDTGTTTWKTPSTKSRREQLKDSIAKRIVLDLTCPQTKANIIQALQTGSGAEGLELTAEPATG